MQFIIKNNISRVDFFLLFKKICYNEIFLEIIKIVLENIILNSTEEITLSPESDKNFTILAEKDFFGCN